MKNVALILGFFDGVHLGHRLVIKSAVDYARENNVKSVLITLKDSPAMYFNKDCNYVFQREKSFEIIKNLGVDAIIQNDFADLHNLTAIEYLENYLIKNFEPISISTGFNHTFGVNKVGNSDLLYINQHKYNYKYFCIEPCMIDNKIVSSTCIKEFLNNGNMQKANEFLANNFTVKSRVIKGMQLGRKLGFPTANMLYPNLIVRIPYGVYKVQVFDKPAVLNWGIKPTIDGTQELLEVHIPNFESDLYGKDLEVRIIKKIRDEKKFNNLEELKMQIDKDVMECLEL